NLGFFHRDLERCCAARLAQLAGLQTSRVDRSVEVGVSAGDGCSTADPSSRNVAAETGQPTTKAEARHPGAPKHTARLSGVQPRRGTWRDGIRIRFPIVRSPD